MKKNKTILYVIIIALIALGAWWYFKSTKNSSYTAPEAPQQETKQTPPAVSITTKDIKETNFTGKIPELSGPVTLSTKANAYVAVTVADFKKQADTDVPAMRKEFGADNPTAQYEIDIDAKDVKGGNTESIVLLVYTYTGGAHGSSVYKVFTVDTDGLPAQTGKILSLSDIVKNDKQKSFTEMVKKELQNWQLDNNGSNMVFTEDVQDLTFDSFANFSLDDKNLTIYFDQYEIGAGALGPVAFPLPLSKVKDFLN